MPLTFNFTGQTLPSTVVWTVQFDTSHADCQPIVTNLPAEASPSAAYGDVGTTRSTVSYLNYPGAPYVGTDVDNDKVYLSTGNSDFAPPLVPLAADTGWAGYRPLGEIVLG